MRAVLLAVVIAASPLSVSAQQAGGWEFSAVPMYFWATALDGQLSAGPATLPVALDFSDAADNLGGALSFHIEASRGRVGVMADLNYIQLASTAPFTVGGRTVEGEFELDNVMFEAGGLFLVNERAGVSILGGLRTYTLAPTIAFTAAGGGATPIDESRTSANAFAGLVLRPRINDRWGFIGRADVGAGDADLTWSAVAGLEYRFKPWGGIEFGYKALGIDVTGGDADLRGYDVTHHGPIVGLRLHWGGL